MQTRYDPTCGLMISVPVYEREIAVKLIQLIIKELKKADKPTDDFLQVIEAIIQHSQRMQ